MIFRELICFFWYSDVLKMSSVWNFSEPFHQRAFVSLNIQINPFDHEWYLSSIQSIQNKSCYAHGLKTNGQTVCQTPRIVLDLWNVSRKLKYVAIVLSWRYFLLQACGAKRLSLTRCMLHFTLFRLFRWYLGNCFPLKPLLPMHSISKGSLTLPPVWKLRQKGSRN